MTLREPQVSSGPDEKSRQSSRVGMKKKFQQAARDVILVFAAA
jgi:hypothetical protein